MPVIANLETPAEYVKKTACGAPAGAIFCFAKNDRTLNKTLFSITARSNLLFTCLHMRNLYKHLIYINPKKFLHFFFLHLIYFAYDHFLRGICQLNVTYGASEILIRQRTSIGGPGISITVSHCFVSFFSGK